MFVVPKFHDPQKNPKQFSNQQPEVPDSRPPHDFRGTRSLSPNRYQIPYSIEKVQNSLMTKEIQDSIERIANVGIINIAILYTNSSERRDQQDDRIFQARPRFTYIPDMDGRAAETWWSGWKAVHEEFL